MWTRTVAAALLLAAGAAAAQNRATELEARSYIKSAFISGVAPAILADRIYPAIFALTADKAIEVRKASADEAIALAGHALARPVFTLEGGAVPLLVVYDLDRNAIPYLALAR